MKKRLLICLAVALLSGCMNKPTEEPVSESSQEEIIDTQVMQSEKPEPEPISLIPLEFTGRVDEFGSVFYLEAENVGMSGETEFIKKTITIDSWNDGGSLKYSTRQIEFLEGYTYEISFEISSSIADRGDLVIRDYTNEYFRQGFSISTETTTVTLRYTHNMPNMTEDIVSLEFFNGTGAQAGQIVVDQVSIRCLNETNLSIKVNQLGYLPQSEKIAIFKYNCGDSFRVIDTATNEVVYTGLLKGMVDNADTAERNAFGDFSAVTAPGTYRIESQFNGKSYDFTIGDNLFDELFLSSLKMLTLQRCGQELTAETAGAYAHEVCHDEEALVYGTDEPKDVSGGWHDAGDYGRYTLTAVKTINDLLLAYTVYPQAFGDEMTGIDSGNGISDVLDEAIVGLDWLKKMQKDWGAVYNAAVTKQFADLVDPQQDHQTVYLLKEENTATASAAGSFAMAAKIFQDIDPERALIYKEAAVKSYQYALAVRGGADLSNPSGFAAGDYLNGSDRDEIYFAACALYVLTHDESYLEEIANFIINYPSELTGITYSDMGGYGSFLLLKDERFEENKELYPLLYNAFMGEAVYLVNKQSADGYQVAVYSYLWGGNMYVANNAMMMLLANDITSDQRFVNGAFEQLSYLLGRNSLNRSFISGYGIVYPKHIHHRMAQRRSELLMGALVGGPDAHADNSDTPPAKKYWDDCDEYSTNEVAIYFNSALVFALAEFADK